MYQRNLSGCNGFFVLLSGLALVAACVLWMLDRPIRNLESDRRNLLVETNASADVGGTLGKVPG